jgi:flagellar capping protein FliD
MDNLEIKAQEMLDKATSKTIEEAKGLITKSEEAVNQAIEKKDQEWQVKFDAMDKEVQEYKSQAELLKQKNEQKNCGSDLPGPGHLSEK